MTGWLSQKGELPGQIAKPELKFRKYRKPQLKLRKYIHDRSRKTCRESALKENTKRNH